MKKSKPKKNYEPVFEDFPSDEETKKQPVISRDYITLKIKGTEKQKTTEGLASILSEYSQENYKEHVKWLRQHIGDELPYRKYQPEMLQFLHLRANLCIYGVGSKRQYISELIKKYLSHMDVWEVKGYLPSLNEKKIYNHFGKFLMSARLANKIERVAMVDLLKEYSEILESNKRQVVIVFHCLDGQNFLNSESQSKLAELFSLPYIQLICTVDNAKIVRYWHPRTKQQLKLNFYNINTKKPNVEEQYYKQHTNEKKDGSEKSLMNIWQSLNRNQKKILKIITKNELNNMSKEEPTNYTVTELLDVCIEEVILASEVQLRENLLELLDHKVITEKLEEKRAKKVIILKKYEKKLLQKILDLRIEFG